MYGFHLFSSRKMDLVDSSQSIPRMESSHTRDFISGLPQVLVDCILLHLPIKEAVRTSVLAREWRYKWTKLPELVFDERSIGLRDGALENNRLMNIIYDVLSHHEGFIQKFTISCLDSKRVDSSDIWISHLERKRTQEIKLEFLEGSSYNVPSRLFACQDLRCLKLKRCNIGLPWSIDFCESLKTLHLDNVSFSGIDFRRLTLRCSVLEELIMVNIHEDTLYIGAPAVKYLYIEGIFSSIIFLYVPCLSYLHVCLSEIERNLWNDGVSNLVNALTPLSGIEKLELRGRVLKLLSVEHIPTRFRTNFNHLTEIYLDVNFKDLAELSSVLCLCRSSPFLKHLEVHVLYRRHPRQFSRLRRDHDFWVNQNQVDGLLDQLQTVRITQLPVAYSEMEFIKYLVRKSPALEKITVVPRQRVRTAMIFEWMQLPQVSVHEASGTIEVSLK